MDNKYDKNGFDRNGYNQFGYDKFGYDKNGFDKDGYDRRGFNAEGFNKLTGLNQDGFDKDGFDKDGFNKDGYDRAGFNKDGFDKYGFGRDGYDVEGYDKNGFNHEGYNRSGYDKKGFDHEGYNRAGYDRDGFNKDGFNKDGYGHDGFNKDGFDKDGYGRDGYNKSGYDRNGYNKKGIDKYGFNVDGYDAEGLDIFGRDKDGYGLDGFDRDGYNKDGFNRDGFHKDDFDSEGFNKYTGLNTEGYDRDGFNINGLDIDGYNREGFDRDGYDREGYNIDGFNSKGFNVSGYDRDGYNHLGFDEDGYDKLGYNEAGYDKFGFNRLGLNKDGYDKNGVNVTGEKEEVKNENEPIRSGLRIKRKSDGERGRIDAVGKTRIYYTLDMYLGTGTKTDASIEKFMELYSIEEDENGSDRERESLYNTNVRRYLYSDYCNDVLIPAQRKKGGYSKLQSYVDSGNVIKDVVFDEVQLKIDAERAAKKMADEAYFAHVDYNENPDLYIGKKEIPGYVIDWADKRASYYYEYKIYTIDSNVGINFVRDITLKNGMFYDFNDLYNRGQNKLSDLNSQYASVADEKLIEIIERNRASKSIHDIVASIQEKQYKIITENMDKKILVLGCAGSGKTMILLHRIRYILFNNPNVDSNSVIVVSPTDILGRESKELSKILNIEKINQCSTADFYAQIVQNLFESNNMFHRTQEFQISELNVNLDESVISNCVSIIDGDSSQKQWYINNKKECLSTEKNKVESLMNGLENTIANELYKDSIKEIICFSYNDIKTIINFVKNKIERELTLKENRKLAVSYLLEYKQKGNSKEKNQDDDDKAKVDKELLKQFDKVDFTRFTPISKDVKRKIIRFAQIMGSISNSFKKKDEITSIIDKISNWSYDQIENCANMLSKDIEDLKKLESISNLLEYSIDVVDIPNKRDNMQVATTQTILEHFQKTFLFAQKIENVLDIDFNPFVIFGEYNDILDEISMLNDAGNSNDFVFDMLIDLLKMKRDRKNHKITANKQQLQKIFHIMLEKFASQNNKRHYLYLDEFQDYSTEELGDLQKYFANAVINLYGDVNQCINTNGIDNVDDLHSVMSFEDEYELKENYRNSSEITEYVNNRFDMDMYKIGLPGSVKESQVLTLDKVENDDRAAIIIADNSILPSLEILESNKNVYFYNEESSIHKNCYNVLTVAQAKGLEFEKVIVIDKNMTKNQLYVACTRAIRDLNVVTLPELEDSFNSTEIDEGNRREGYKNKKLCQYCGGEFKGIFSRVCRECGKPKDY